MRHFFVVWWLLITILLMAASPAPPSPDRSPQVVLSAQSAAIPLDATLSLQVTLTNPESVDNSDLVVYRHMLWSGLGIRVRTSDGIEIEPEGETHDHALCPPPPPKPNDFVHLEVGQFLGQPIRITPSELGIKAPGTYSIYVQYWFRVLPEGKEWRISLREQPIESAPITVTVVAAEGAK